LRYGEIEDYLPQGFRSLDRMLDLLKNEEITRWLIETKGTATTKNIKRIVFDVLGVDDREINSLPQEFRLDD